MIKKNLIISLLFVISSLSQAGLPLWTLTPLTATTISIPANDSATVQYIVTNKSKKTHRLIMQPIVSITQNTTGFGVCGNPFILKSKESCTLTLQISGSQLSSPISNGPIVCEQSSTLQCYRPSQANILNVTQTPPITDATISVTGSPLTLTTDGPVGTLIIHNNSLIVNATNITSNFSGTALDGNVTETGNTCTNVAPQASCTLSYTPGSTVVALTSFPIQGTNTNAITGAIQINAGVTITTVSPSSGPASGGSGVTITGTGFTGATGVTFGGVAATSVNVVNSTTITAVTPAHATGSVNVVVTTPTSSSTKTNGFSYITTTVGQSAYGGIIACLNTGNNLIAATTDNSSGIGWGSPLITTGATSTTNGAANTVTIVNTLGNSGPNYAARLCSNYEVDSQGNTPCQTGNSCYNDWFLPAGNNLTNQGQLNCLYTNKNSIGGFSDTNYWSSTEQQINTAFAWSQNFSLGGETSAPKSTALKVRCVRTFTP